LQLPVGHPTPGNFHGCIRTVILNGEELAFFENVDGGKVVDIHECGENACTPGTCLNQGKCLVAHDHYQCLCDHPFNGKRCQNKMTGTTSAMGFNGHSFLQFNQSDIMKHITGPTLNLTIRLKLPEPENFTTIHHEEKILAFAGERELGGDFFRFFITVHREIRLLLNLGSGTVSLSHPIALVPNQWHNVSIVRDGRKVTLTVDAHVPVRAMAPDGSDQLNIYDSVFIGGHPDVNNVPESGITGCISEIHFSQTSVIRSPSVASRAVNIEQCS